MRRPGFEPKPDVLAPCGRCARLVDNIHTFAHELDSDTDGTPNILAVGGGDIGYHTARLLQERGLKPRLVERGDHVVVFVEIGSLEEASSKL